jgi:sugar/nucleoside kinase (ribokinase family)
MIPQAWRETPIVHLAPVIGEVSPRILSYFPEATRAVTPQGWLREWDAGGQVRAGAWPEGAHVLRQSDAAVISVEDIEGDEALIEQMAASCPVLAVTHGAGGARLFLNGESHSLDAEETEQIDPTGAGDIFAAAFFVRLHYGRDALAAAQFANQVAARSVARRGLEGVPTRDEIYDLLPEAV